jgi:hypothetical protein
MTGSAREFLDAVQTELAAHGDDNRLVPLIVEGKAPRAVFAAIAAEQYRIVRSDWRSFLLLASRAEEQSAREFFSALAPGEGLALGKLAGLAAATGMDEDALREYEPRAGCQAYPAYFAWLALNGRPADVIVALITNFAGWGRHGAAIATAMREQYGFDNEACGFFDFDTPVPDVEGQAVVAVQRAMDAGELGVREARTYARLFQSYELSFWNTIADEVTA